MAGKLLRMDNVGIIVQDMKAVIAFFEELGLKVEGKVTVEGKWVDHCIGLKNVKSDIVMMKAPDGSRLELSTFHTPKVRNPDPNAPTNTLGIRRLMFAVTDVDDVVKRLAKRGGMLVDEIVEYENIYRLCYVRGPEGILIGLAQPLRQ